MTKIYSDEINLSLSLINELLIPSGMMSEGIYRRSGSSSAVVKLLEAFRRDAWATQITRNSYTEHDVATVLRRFLRDLPDPLFPADIHDRLCLASGEKNLYIN